MLDVLLARHTWLDGDPLSRSGYLKTARLDERWSMSSSAGAALRKPKRKRQIQKRRDNASRTG